MVRSIGTVLAAILPVAAAVAQEAQAPPERPRRPGRAILPIPDVPRDEVIGFALYTVHGGVLKLTAQLYPLEQGESRTVALELERAGEWRRVAAAEVIVPGWAAMFRVEDWDDTKAVRYRVTHPGGASFAGLIRANPREQEEIVVCGFTGNSIHPAHGGDIPKDDLVANVVALDADVLFFSGDQVYDHNRHLAAWLKFGRDFGKVLRDRPTITIPDDHDVGQANLWGHGGRKSNTGAGHDGGYYKPVEYVKEVERAQTSHLPDPFDPTPIERGIGVYYTNLTWGRISFAILEDRKFKTGPAGLVPQRGPRPDHILDPDYDPASVDVPQARLLGERQLAFLDHWARDWTDADLKVALSQTIFCGGAHIHGKIGGRLHADLDSNGWPQTGRNKAIAALRKAFAVHYAGDQHLATIFHHGIDDWNDSIFSFCVPSIANLYLRWWSPPESGGNRAPGQDAIFGEHLDGFGNKVTLHAVANPDPERATGDRLTTRAAGFGVMRLNKASRKITMECWPRNVDVSSPDASPYPGWPMTIHQIDNYARKAVAHLPTLVVEGDPAPVVEIVDEQTGELVYALRLPGTRFRPKVFRRGTYTVRVGEGDAVQVFAGVRAEDAGRASTLLVRL
ncbi:MAG: hypothetical protein AAF628_20490 [Planctomycetota bacterium]